MQSSLIPWLLCDARGVAETAGLKLDAGSTSSELCNRWANPFISGPQFPHLKNATNVIHILKLLKKK